MRRAQMLAAGGVVALAAALAGCTAEPTTTTVTRTVTATVTVPGPASTTVTPAAVTRTVLAPPPAPKVAIDEGVWIVGEDVAAGTYRTIAAVSGFCYWAIYRGGSNQQDIVNNGTPTGGRPVVTLRKGQVFESNGCGSWAKR